MHFGERKPGFWAAQENHFRSVESIAENVRSALIVPTANTDRASASEAAVAAVCLVNKRGGDGEFGEADERVASTCLR